jgi:glycosyltransferase involved in cell wall biosynthesis
MNLPTRLTLFFTRDVSLQTWDAGGMFDREVALYRCLQEKGIQITFVTFGGRRDLELARRLPGIRVICNRWGWPRSLYILWITSSLPWLSGKPQIIKSNQFSGGEIALNAARHLGAKLIVRGGYIFSLNAARQNGENSLEAVVARSVEDLILPCADRVVVTTPAMVDFVRERYKLAATSVVLIPNYALTDVFKPIVSKKLILKKPRLCFIGRLEKEKNLNALLEALRGLDLELDIVGSGSLQKQLENFAGENGVHVNFLGNISHSKLPDVISAADVYIQPSLYEGHPKTIIEAMSCGAVVIAGDSPGIRELISHRQTGFLCPITPEGIHSAILEVLSDPGLCRRIGESARQYAVDNFSLDRVVEMEFNLYQELISNNKEQS